MILNDLIRHLRTDAMKLAISVVHLLLHMSQSDLNRV